MRRAYDEVMAEADVLEPTTTSRRAGITWTVGRFDGGWGRRVDFVCEHCGTHSKHQEVFAGDGPMRYHEGNAPCVGCGFLNDVNAYGRF